MAEADLALLHARQTCHDFAPEPVDEALLTQALEAAIWAPNHHLTNTWRFRSLGPQTREAVIRANTVLVQTKRGADAGRKKAERWRAIPGWLLVTSLRDHDPFRSRENYAACCCAVQNLMLAFSALGVGTKWTSGAVTRLPVFPGLVGYAPEAEDFVGLIWYGWPALETPLSKRQPLSEVWSARP